MVKIIRHKNMSEGRASRKPCPSFYTSGFNQDLLIFYRTLYLTWKQSTPNGLISDVIRKKILENPRKVLFFTLNPKKGGNSVLNAVLVVKDAM